MPIVASQAVTITCDNPTCPGPPPALDAHRRRGWLRVSVETFGEAPDRYVFCTLSCASQGLTALNANPAALTASPL